MKQLAWFSWATSFMSPVGLLEWVCWQRQVLCERLGNLWHVWKGEIPCVFGIFSRLYSLRICLSVFPVFLLETKLHCFWKVMLKADLKQVSCFGLAAECWKRMHGMSPSSWLSRKSAGGDGRVLHAAWMFQSDYSMCFGACPNTESQWENNHYYFT